MSYSDAYFSLQPHVMAASPNAPNGAPSVGPDPANHQQAAGEDHPTVPTSDNSAEAPGTSLAASAAFAPVSSPPHLPSDTPIDSSVSQALLGTGDNRAGKDGGEADEDGDTAMMDGADGAAGAAAKPAASRKKKGTATAVKPPKKGRGIKKTTKTPKKKAASAAAGGAASSSSPAAEGSAKGTGGDGGDESDPESDNGPYCICRGPDDHRWMIQCDGCEDWFHGECVKIVKEIGETLIQSYICPNCTDGKKYVTRYKKTCSLPGCLNPARVYSEKNPSIFCCQDHCNQWWEQLIATLPPEDARDNRYRLTREDFMGLLAGTDQPGETWKIGDAPFGIPPDFWDRVDPTEVLSREETDIIGTSAAARYQLAEEIVLCKKMLELLEMANARHKAAVEAKAIEKDACGYDVRLDIVGVQHQFAAFIKSPEGEAVFKSGKLEAPPAAAAAASNDGAEASVVAAAEDSDPRTDGMCKKRKCKTHAGWFNMHTRHARFQIRELAREAKQKLDAETRVRNSAAVRHFRRRYEHNWVEPIEGGED